MRSLAAALLLPAFANGYKTFKTVCSKPTESVNYVSSADTRSTLDILWSCVLTIIACTWSVQHLNVPEQRERRNPGWIGNIKWALKRTWTSTKWMLITIMAPEVLLVKDWSGRHLAKNNSASLQEFAMTDGVPWSLSHTLFADMGGFVLRSYSSERLHKETKTGHPYKSTKSKYSQPFHLTALELSKLRAAGFLDRLPYMTEEELLDKSKGDSFVRTISLIQILWMVIQIIARGFRHLAISQLEIGVLAFAACAVILYIINWSKPKGVQTPITIMNFEGEIPDEVITIIEKQRAGNDIILNILGTARDSTEIRGTHIPNDYVYDPDLPGYDDNQEVWAMIAGTLIFGAIHLAAWNFVFPSRIELVLWRCSSMICTFFTVLILVSAAPDVFLDRLIPDRTTKFSFFLMKTAMLIYVVARLFLLVELFRTLCFLPPSAYIATWASNIPHLA
ncbi:uncharacterized protein LY89DRAFT_707221 [Mollisia scopiformis]|uniref:Uncharacterized protein n=1 Tax=Mollisia scopiformis TaxID=149040 RepID=A0A194X951_MOLSC|nr:uncharacterized protein LY89DRAFT_707221 [Mollisia scopiformis]KUJ16695.1 hypothetical protein LY89DRAFT_707221 [Mollisia scopiformis]